MTTTTAAFSERPANHEILGLRRVDSLWDIASPTWRQSIQEQFAEIGALKLNWDGYQSGPIRREVLFYAHSLLKAVMTVKMPAPHLTPMSNEGILLEWHDNDVDLTIDISAAGEAWVEYHNKNSKKGKQGWTVRADFESLTNPIENISKR